MQSAGGRAVVAAEPRFILPAGVEPTGVAELAKGRPGLRGVGDEEATPAPSASSPPSDECHLPPPLMWQALPPPEGEDYALRINEFAEQAVATMSYVCQSTQGWKALRESGGVRASSRRVRGSPVEVVRHELEIAAPADVVLDLYNQLNYTWVVDAYTYDLYAVEDVPTTDLSWLHVVHTVDRMAPPLRNIRDFCTLDMVDPHRMMLVSKSVVHPALFPPPQHWIRMPLCYALRVEPLAAGRCRVVQVQWSDSAGMLRPRMITPGVVEFGFDFYARFTGLVEQAVRQRLPVGRGSPHYLRSPLRAGWRREPGEMVPGLRAGLEPVYPFRPVPSRASKM